MDARSNEVRLILMQLISTFSVVGRPAPQGSKTYLGNGRFKEQSPHVAAWRNDVRNAASLAFGEALIDGPIFTRMTFLFNRPKCHHVSSNPEKPLKPSAPFWHITTPDRDKLERATNDALTGVVWADDSQVAATLSQKVYADPGVPSGAIIYVYLLTGKEWITLA
jgi:Holliday junction resolvase RusA-like endonuclease